MARTTPHVEHGKLTVGSPGATQAIHVGTPAWFMWLDTATAFTFACAHGTYTARRERSSSGRGGLYWRAYQRRAGGLKRAYLGKAQELTLERLQAVAADLADLANPATPKSAPDLAAAAAALQAAAPRERPAHPSGTVAFLFTDIEGSMQLWEQHKEVMRTALARHDTLLRQAVAAHGGVIFKTVGDGVHAAFTRAIDAVQAALDAQRMLHRETWDSTGPLRVRIALHTGVAELRDGDYFGPPLNRVARMLALAHGGQILLSRATHDLVVDDLPAQTTVRALGDYQLKDLTRPEPIFQCVGADLPADFPPLRSDEPQVGTPGLHVLATKLYIPKLQRRLVARPRLFERLSEGLAGRLTLIAAPAGFGKTTLLCAWIEQLHAQGIAGDDTVSHRQAMSFALRPPGVAWLSLDPMDNDPTVFLRYLIAALQTIAPDFGEGLLALLRLPQLPPLDTLLTALVNDAARLAHQSLLVLDDYHVIATPAIHQALAFLLDHLPPQLHLVIATREDPPLPLARLRVKGQLTELRAQDLRFNSDEARSFVEGTSPIPLSVEAIATLERRTEGWIAGLQLATLALRDRPNPSEFVAAFAGSNRYVVDYLLEEVVRQQPHHIQTFLLQTAVLDRLCGSLCDAVLGMDEPGSAGRQTDALAGPRSLAPASYSQLILDELVHRNLFIISLDDAGQWYRYHHLFADVMRARLASGATAAEVTTLHCRASNWFERHGFVAEAVQHALTGGDFERAADLIERDSLLIAARGQAQTVLGWLAALPEAFLRTRASLCIVYAASLVMDNQPMAIERHLQSAEACAREMSPEQAPLILGQMSALRAVCMRISGDLERAVALAQLALELLPASEPFWRAPVAINASRAYLVSGDVTASVERTLAAMIEPARASGNPFAYLTVIFGLGRLQALQGRLQAAAATYRQVLQALPELAALQDYAAHVIYCFGLGDLLREWNDLDAAEYHLEQGMDLITRLRSQEAEFVLLSYLTRARLKQARGDLEGAARAVAAFLQLARERDFAQILVARAVAFQARLALVQGDLATAAAWAVANGPGLVNDLRYLHELEHLTLVRIWIAQGRGDSAVPHLHDTLILLGQLLPAAEMSERFSSVIEIRILQALALQAHGALAEALAALQHALVLAQPEGFARIFLDEGPPMAKLLGEARRRGIVPVYAARLLALFPAEAELRAVGGQSLTALPQYLLTAPLVEQLTARELEVLRLLATGASNGAIAEALVISIGTAKKHVNNILAKLDMRSRTEAALWAREQGLLTERSRP